LRRLADERGLLLIFDEVQTGIGRTGKLFAYEWSGAEPDIMAIAKGIGGGFPMGACLATERAASGMTIGSHASTFGGNPLAMAVGNAVLDVVLTPDFLPRVERVANFARQQLAALPSEFPHVFDDVRGQGLMLGLKMKVPSPAFIDALRERGLLTVAAGGNVVRLLPPLIVEEEHVREAMCILGDAAAAYKPGAAEPEAA
jgi:acetylornithine/N-succinyldiaminopimelate aminotransferase